MRRSSRPRRVFGALESLEQRYQMTGVPYMVADINPGPSSSTPNGFGRHNPSFIGLNGAVFFTANNGTQGDELWRTNGTAIGTALVKDIAPGHSSGMFYPEAVRTYNGQLIFAAENYVHGRELWTSDGTDEGTHLIKDSYPGYGSGGGPGELTSVGGTLFYYFDDGVHGTEIWKTDGTSDGTTLVRDIWTESTGFGEPSPRALAAFQNELFFTAYTSDTGAELWHSDGTVTGTMIVGDIIMGPNGLDPDDPRAGGAYLYFVSEDDESIWRTDGTAEGTIKLGPDDDCDNDLINNVQGSLYFICDDGTELWITDGSKNGTHLVKNFTPDEEDAIQSLTPNGDRMYFVLEDETNTFDEHLYVTDGTTNGTKLIGSFDGHVSSLEMADGTLYFSALNSQSGYELWTSDGTAAGTRMFADVRPGAGSSTPSDLHFDSGRLYFTADDGVHGRELWVLPLSSSTPGDLDFNGVVDRGDLSVLTGNYGLTNAAAEQGDLDGNRRINLRDVVLLRDLMQSPATAPGAVVVTPSDAPTAPTPTSSRSLTARRNAAVDRALIDTVDEPTSQPPSSLNRLQARRGTLRNSQITPSTTLGD